METILGNTIAIVYSGPARMFQANFGGDVVTYTASSAAMNQLTIN